MKTLKYLIFIFVAMVMGAGIYGYLGFYPMGADVPHNKLTYWILETLRERSIANASADIVVPPLEDPELLLMGGPDYNEMCSACHLEPGKLQSDMSLGLYPAPPNLAGKGDAHGHGHGEDSDAGHGSPEQAARRQFWIIKHGIKASGMPAWGPTHDDQRIWAMVAFLQKLPDLTPEQYQILTARDDNSMGAHH